MMHPPPPSAVQHNMAREPRGSTLRITPELLEAAKLALASAQQDGRDHGYDVDNDWRLQDEATIVLHAGHHFEDYSSLDYGEEGEYEHLSHLLARTCMLLVKLQERS